LAGDIVALIKQMAEESRFWGAERIRVEPLPLGLGVSRSTIQKNIYEVRGPGSPKQTWGTFLRNHAKEICACGFFQTYDLFFRTLFAFAIVDLGSRRLVHFGVTGHPTGAWLAQQMRKAPPFGEGPRTLIRDHDRKYGKQFAKEASGPRIEVLRTPCETPRANAACERFLGRVRREGLGRFLILSEQHVHRPVKEYQEYFGCARPHQGIGQSIPCQEERGVKPQMIGNLVSRPVLDGSHHVYHWKSGERAPWSRAA
jgi:putative transposase